MSQNKYFLFLQSHDQEEHWETLKVEVKGIGITAVCYIARASQHSGDNLKPKKKKWTDA